MLDFKSVGVGLWRAEFDNLACYIDQVMPYERRKRGYFVHWGPTTGRVCDTLCVGHFDTMPDAEAGALYVLLSYMEQLSKGKILCTQTEQ